MSRWLPSGCGVCLGAALSLGSVLAAAAPPAAGSASEADRERARTLGYAGVAAYAKGEYAAASEQLEASFALLPVPSLGMWSARALVKLGKWVEAEQRYRAVASMSLAADAPKAQTDAKATAELELAELSLKLPSVRVQILGAPPAQVTVTLDGAALPAERWSEGQHLNPGRHAIVGTYREQRTELELVASEGRENVVLRFAEPAVLPLAATEPAASAPAPDPGGGSQRAWRTAGWIGVGTGGAALVLGAVTYLVGSNKYDELVESGSCVDGGCEKSSELDTYNTLRTVSFVSLISGVALGAFGVTVLALDPGAPGESSAEAPLRLRVGWGSANLVGHF
ncbi:MAG TPA: hypothetical protein VJU61_26295 [Polyangiaceae bacterium]|nr:hypothetical protein [Polyangiaceae bacterium]